MLKAWRARDALRGREITWHGPTGARPQGVSTTVGRGRAEGVNGAGHLIVRLADGGGTSLDAGEVHLEEIG